MVCIGQLSLIIQDNLSHDAFLLNVRRDLY